MKLLLVDLSSVFRPIWEMSGQESDQDHASRATVARVHGLAQSFDGTAICCDSRKSWRRELAPTYKANRPPSEEPMLHQLRLAQEQLAADGFPVWQVDGFEADDLIATAVRHYIEPEKALDTEVMIESGDKDLMQLVEPRVQVRTRKGAYGPAEVQARFGVRPDQMRDWIVLVGDKSDNVAGVPGIGEKRAAELLQKHGSLFSIYQNLGDSCTRLGLTPSTFTALKESVQVVELGRKLVSLREDVELPFAQIFEPRKPKTKDAEFTQEDEDMGEMADEANSTDEAEERRNEPRSEPPPASPIAKTSEKEKSEDFAAEPEKGADMVLAPAEWSKGLEPRSYAQAKLAAWHMYNSRLFAAFGTWQSVLAVILAGRELGLGVMQSLRGFHIVEGKPVLSSGLMAALVLNSGKAKVFRCIHTSPTKATFRAQRIGDDDFIEVSFTIEEARAAGLIKPRSGWEKYPADMLVARATARAARLVFPDVCAGLYLAEELGREDLEAA